MRTTVGLIALGAAIVLVFTPACQRTGTEEPRPVGVVPEGPTAGTPSELEPTESDGTVQITAYIQVSSGCQQPTVDLLERLDAGAERLSLELIDFGSEDGLKRWREAGHDCMTILIDGHETVTFGEEGHRRIVTFSYPPGFQWTLEDLETSIKDALAGNLYLGEEEGATRILSRMPTLRITGRESEVDGQKVGEVSINGRPAITLRTEYDGLPPLQRAEQAASRLRRAMGANFKPADIKTEDLDDGKVALVIQDEEICIADEAQAKILDSTPKKLAKDWVASLKKALTEALADQQSQAPQTPA